MGLSDSIIETGVDKLVNLVNSRTRVSSYEAAKELGVSSTVIMEWADFLEEEGIISIEYKFTKPYLVARKLGKKEVEAKAKEFSGKKDVFVRKAEGSLSFLEREAKKLNSLKGEFDKIKDELGFDISHVKSELEELEAYEKLKIDLDRQIDKQKTASLEKVKDMTKQFLREKKRYQDILEEIHKEEKVLEREKVEAKSLEDSEKFIKDRIASIKEIIGKVEIRVKKEEESVGVSEKNLQKLALMANSVKDKVKKEKDLIDPLVEKSKRQEKKIKELQDRVIMKITEKEKKLKGVKKASKKIKDLFNRKTNVIDLIEKTNKDRNELQNELIALIKKAKSFQLSSRSRDVGSEIIHLEKKFKEVDAKKKDFEEELKKLSSALHKSK